MIETDAAVAHIAQSRGHGLELSMALGCIRQRRFLDALLQRPDIGDVRIAEYGESFGPQFRAPQDSLNTGRNSLVG